MVRCGGLGIHFLLLSSFGLASGVIIQPRNWDYNVHYEVGFEVASTTSITAEQPYLSSSSLPNTMTLWNQTTRSASATTILPAVANSTSMCTNSNNKPILLLNGFGVGSFHQHRLISRLLQDRVEGGNTKSQQKRPQEEQRKHRTIYCMDYLGQGKSWPKNCQDGKALSEQGLQYSADTWIDQIVTFIEEVVLPEQGVTKIHLVGNSLGGHLAAYVAMRRPDLIESICLLNPTPIWGLNLPGWSGRLPAPFLPKLVGRFLFDRIRDLGTIEKFLEQTYSRKEAFSEELMNQIRACTLGNGGHAAFASILWSPSPRVSPIEDKTVIRSRKNFQSCLAQLTCDVLLVFGKDDPWCKPAFAKKMLQALDQRDSDHAHRYIEIENAGHCPNHEAPQAVAHVVGLWVDSHDRSEGSLVLVDSENSAHKMSFQEEWGETMIAERDAEDINMGLVDRLATIFV